ncbi:MAG: aldo/keto reductase, partial [Candidatus Pacebacteria bacterium]|nr:aldo/keto reductase [Candidatus Paceibacterota bacterium]
MKYRKLGKTGLEVSIIGLGTEYLNKKTKETVFSVVHEAIEEGVNYFDLVFAFPEYRDNFGVAFKGYRDKIIIAGHVGCAETNGQYRLTRDVKENETLFLDLLKRLHTDHVDILMIQMVNAFESYDRIMKPGGLMELAQRFQ